MKKSLIALFCFGIIGCASTGGLTPQAQADVQAVLNVAYEAANVAQQLNTGFQTVAPAVETILTMTHNQGDAATLQSAATQSAQVAAALNIVQGAVSTAIKNSPQGSIQTAAVNQALSPAMVQAAVSVATATPVNP